MNRIRLFFSIFVIIILFSGYSRASGQIVLRLGTVDNFPPLVYQKDGNFAGVDIDIIHEMARRLDIKVEIKGYPWRRVLESLEEGIVDGGFTLFKNKEREAFCLYTGILHYEQYQLFVRNGENFHFSGIKDLYGKTIGIERGVFICEDFSKAVIDGKIMLEQVNDMAMLNIQKLCKNRIKAIIGERTIIPYFTNLAGCPVGIESLGPIHEKKAAYLVLSKNSNLSNKTGLQRQITDVLRKMWEDGTCDRIFNRYYKTDGKIIKIN